MYALPNVRDALHATKRYFAAVGLYGWLKLGLVVFLLGLFTGLYQWFNVPFELLSETGFDGDQFQPGALQDQLWSWEFASVAAVVGLLGGIYVGVRYLAAVCEFVFVESLRSEAIFIRQFGRENLGSGVWLLLFRGVLAGGLWLGVALTVGAIFALGDGTGFADITPEQVAAAGLLSVLLVIGWWVADLLTTAFVVPIMLLTRCGPISGWLRFGAVIRSNPVGILGFLVVAWSVGFGLWALFAIVGLVVTFFGLFVFAFLIIGLAEIDSTLVPVGFALLLLAYICYQYVLALVGAPVRSYVRYHALLVLGDTESSLDLIPDQRAAVRAPSSESDEQTAASDAAASDGTDVTEDRDTDQSGEQWGRGYSHVGESPSESEPESESESESEWEWGDVTDDADSDGDDTDVDGHDEDTGVTDDDDDDDELRW